MQKPDAAVRVHRTVSTGAAENVPPFKHSPPTPHPLDTVVGPHSTMLRRDPAYQPPTSRFAAAPLSRAHERKLKQLGRTLLKQAIVECETSLQGMDQHWKHVRNSYGIKVYKAKTIHAPSQIMTTGIIKASLNQVMQCLYADNTAQFRMLNALLMPKEHLDCEVLHALDVQDDSHPFRFNGVKWCATTSGSLGKTKDLCYFESTGLTQTLDKDGHPLEYGYCFLESYDLPQCPKLDAFSIGRAKISIRHIFRELPMGATVVMTHSTVDSSTLPMWIHPQGSIPPQVLSIVNAAEVAQSVELSLRVHQQTSDGLTVYNKAATATHHNTSPRPWAKLSFLLNRHPKCTLCRNEAPKLIRRRIVEVEGNGIKTSRQLFCCTCASPTVSSFPTPVGLAPTPVDYEDNDDDGSSMLLSMRSSSTLHVSGYASSSSSSACSSESSVHMLELDDEDALDELSYSGLPFTRVPPPPLVHKSSQVVYHSETEDSSDECSESPRQPDEFCCHMHSVHPASTSIATELSRLTVQMDHIWGIVRANKTQADYFRGCNRIEYL
ncbi:hypothetical protein H310_00889 [Aphanomyces invadans]|uniref:START domain-containing protein n=1 Tax=Aphanomyces invadans TaxID=157072 RepID=A0A024UQX1_9STRA|nr:hypothetical protein H310_00889 [Aphanomyces invadans]ETW08252.1 hypothetical protein H310_00889 [Aphanomyces invadans]|eukprot:XP_008862057.1 hypothetical protein H310_00889 [Aphanomyces invadans]